MLQRQSREVTGRKSTNLGRLKEPTSTNKRGREAEDLAFQKLRKASYDVTFISEQPYDLLVHAPDKIYRIQVKCIMGKKNRVNLTRGASRKQAREKVRKSYKKDEFDFLAAVDIQKDLLYLIPIDQILQESRDITKWAVYLNSYEDYLFTA